MRLFLTIFALFAASPAFSAPDPAVVHATAIRQGEIAYTEGWFGTGETRLHYVEAGKGPLIILYHGFPSFWYSWFDQMEVLKTRYRVVAVDGLGAGLSAKPERLEPYRIERLAAQLDGLARHLNGKHRFTLIGHDWGAALSFAYAQAYPKRLHSVIGMSAPPYSLFLDLVARNPEQQRISTYMQQFRALTLDTIRDRKLAPLIAGQSYAGLHKSGAIGDAEFALFQTSVGDPHALNAGMNWYRANVPPFEAIRPRDFWPASNRKIAVPALLIWGEADRTFVPQFLDRLKEVAPGASIARLPGIGHWTPIEDPAKANSAILAFLDQHPPR